MKHTSMNITESLWGVVGLDTKAYSMKFQPTWEEGAGGFGSAPVHGQIMHACYLKNCLEPGQFYVSVIPSVVAWLLKAVLIHCRCTMHERIKMSERGGGFSE